MGTKNPNDALNEIENFARKTKAKLKRVADNFEGNPSSRKRRGTAHLPIMWAFFDSSDLHVSWRIADEQPKDHPFGRRGRWVMYIPMPGMDGGL